MTELRLRFTIPYLGLKVCQHLKSTYFFKVQSRTEIFYDSNKLYCAGFYLWVIKLIILIFRVSKYSKIFQTIVAQAKKGTPPSSSLSVMNNVKSVYTTSSSIIKLYIHLDILSKFQVNSQKHDLQKIRPSRCRSL